MQIKKFGTFTFVCQYRSNRSGFVHECTMFNEHNCELESSKCQYYNRTWEPRTYYTAIRDCLWSYRSQKIERTIESWKRENGKIRLPKGMRDELTKEFDSSELGKQIKEALNETESHRGF